MSGMSDVEQLAQLKERANYRNLLAADSVELREKIEELEHEHNGIVFWLEESERELQRLSSGLVGMVFAALGQRGAKVEKKQRQIDGLREDHEALGRLLESARGELAKLDAELDELTEAQTQYDALRHKRQNDLSGATGEHADQLRELSKQRDESTTRVKALVAATEAGREAIEHLHDEVHVIASMGRCRMAEGNGLLRGVMQAGRKSTVAECAGRAQKSLARFRRKIEDSGISQQLLGGLADAEALILTLSKNVSTSKYEVRTVDHDTVGQIDAALRNVLGNVEDQLSSERNRVGELESKIEALLEKAE